MLKRIFVFIVLVLFVAISGALWVGYHAYTARQARLAAYEAAIKAKKPEVTVRLKEAATVEEMVAAMQKAGLPAASGFTAAQKNYVSNDIVFTRPAGRDLEGYLFPDTYRFAEDSSADIVLARILENFKTKLGSLGVSVTPSGFVIPGYENLTDVGADGQPGWSLYDVLTLASIIEKESGGKNANLAGPNRMSLDEERRTVAGVFYNRLSIGMPLQSDATINYLTGKGMPAPLFEDLKTKSPYNTYLHKGLPPGPICNPSLGSIAAALRPLKTDYFYFQHKQPSGEVIFNKTFDAHVNDK
jgi:UPF0755 protein